jgi:hypothetical protein
MALAVRAMMGITHTLIEDERVARSVLPPAAQPLENLIYRLLCAIAGLSDVEARGLQDRLARML